MKKTRLTAIALLAAVSCSLLISAGCSKVKDLANEAENAVSELGDKVRNFEDNITGGSSENAKQLNSILQGFYSQVKTGTINETNTGYLITAELPKATATQAQRSEAANSLTVFSALEWQDMTSHFTDEMLSQFVFSNGNVQPAGSASGKKITQNTTLGELYG